MGVNRSGISATSRQPVDQRTGRSLRAAGCSRPVLSKQQRRAYWGRSTYAGIGADKLDGDSVSDVVRRRTDVRNDVSKTFSNRRAVKDDAGLEQKERAKTVRICARCNDAQKTAYTK